MRNSQERENTIAVIGGGLAGLTAALSLAPVAERSGTEIALLAPLHSTGDGRTTALMQPSIDVLNRLGVWEECREKSAPLSTMRLIDDTGRLIRAPLATFHASEIDQSSFGYNIPNAVLLAALEEKIAAARTIKRHDTTASSIVHFDSHAEIHMSDGETLTAGLVVAADGRRSMAREAAGIEVKSWAYPQTALVLNFSHQLPHGGVSNEFHTPTGPFTQVPLPPSEDKPNRSSLVWVVNPSRKEAILARTDAENEIIIERGLHSILGEVSIEGPIQSFELSGFVARQFAKGRTFVVGEAAHAFPPIGAQGFNLSLRDIEALGEVLHGADLMGDPERLVRRYHRSRAADVISRTYAVDAMNRSLLSGFLPVQMARSLAVATLSGIPPLRQIAMHLGMGEGPSSLRERWAGQA